MLSLRIAVRFLSRSPVQSGFIVAGIMVGIAVQVFVGSLITSLQANLIQTTVGNSPQVTLEAERSGDPIVYDALVAKAIAGSPEVRATAKVYDFSALYTVANGDTAPLGIKGGDITELDSIYRVARKTVKGSADLSGDGVLVGLDFADQYGVSVGDPLALRLSDGRDVNLTVSGIFDLGSAAANKSRAFCAAGLGRSATGLTGPDQYSAIESQLTDPFLSSVVARRWREVIPADRDARVVDWQAENADLLAALRSQSSSSYMIQAFVLIAVALGIASTLAISAVQKSRQIGILKAMGMSDAASGLVFLWQALLLGVSGTLAGIAAGYALIWGFSFAPTSFDIVVEPAFVAFSASVGVGVALLSSLIPTRKTTRLDPIEVIQRG